MAITVAHHGIIPDELDAQDSVADPDSEILEGEVRTSGKMTAGTPAGLVSATYLDTTVGRFHMTYPFSEQTTMVSGEVCPTDESTGQNTFYKADGSWFASRGAPAFWEVTDGGFVKHYYMVT